MKKRIPQIATPEEIKEEFERIEKGEVYSTYVDLDELRAEVKIRDEQRMKELQRAENNE